MDKDGAVHPVTGVAAVITALTAATLTPMAAAATWQKEQLDEPSDKGIIVSMSRSFLPCRRLRTCTPWTQTCRPQSGLLPQQQLVVAVMVPGAVIVDHAVVAVLPAVLIVVSTGRQKWSFTKEESEKKEGAGRVK